MTRKFLAIVPDGQDDFRLNDKSFTLGALANHVAELTGFGTIIVQNDGIDFAKGEYPAQKFTSSADRLAFFDKSAAALKEAVANATWDSLAQTWTMRAGEQVYAQEKKSKLVRTFYMSHSAHHRAQLGLYLRQLGIAIPGAYGPSADEM